MNNATVALRESHKWIRFKIPFPVIRSSIGMLYTSAALPRYRPQSAVKPLKDYDFKEPERLASVNTHQVQMWVKGRRTKRQSWPPRRYRWSQHSLALPPVLWLEGGLFAQLLSQCQHNSLWGLDRSSCQWLPQNRRFEKTQGSLVSQISHWLLGAGSVITNDFACHCPEKSKAGSWWQQPSHFQHGPYTPSHSPFCTYTAKGLLEEPCQLRHAGHSPGCSPRTVAREGRQCCWGTNAPGWSSQLTTEPASDRAPGDVMLSIQGG